MWVGSVSVSLRGEFQAEWVVLLRIGSQGLYLFPDPLDQTVDPSVSSTNETKGKSLIEWIILVRWIGQII